ncbi:hypothetical protein M3Y99_00542400 [Aphelenchoides fujianensis]|nr:hypothetical protein M3Y99_00542400 [Aphelenchoides fujianensis]
MDVPNFGPIAKAEGDPKKAGSIVPKFFFTAEELQRSPSIMHGFSANEEQRRLQEGCTVIRRIAERLTEMQKEVVKISQLCVSVSMIQLRRFFAIHSLRNFDPVDVGAAALFMTTKSEECPRRLEYVVRAWYKIRYEMETGKLDEVVTISKPDCEKFGEYLVWLENIILQSIGFNLLINVPHPIVLQLAAQHRKDDKKFHEAVFWLTTDALHITNWAVRYNAATIGCCAFYLAAVWKDPSYVFPPPLNGKEWYNRCGDATLTAETLHAMTREFIAVWRDFDKQTHLSMSLFDHRTPPHERLDGELPAPTSAAVIRTPPASQLLESPMRSDLLLPPPPPPLLPPPQPQPAREVQPHSSWEHQPPPPPPLRQPPPQGYAQPPARQPYFFQPPPMPPAFPRQQQQQQPPMPPNGAYGRHPNPQHLDAYGRPPPPFFPPHQQRAPYQRKY